MVTGNVCTIGDGKWTKGDGKCINDWWREMVKIRAGNKHFFDGNELNVMGNELMVTGNNKKKCDGKLANGDWIYTYGDGKWTNGDEKLPNWDMGNKEFISTNVKIK